MIVDCGGGTVDVTVHELDVLNGHLHELHKATGGPHGSCGVYFVEMARLCFVSDMSYIKNDGLDQYGAGHFEQQQFGTAGIEGVNLLVFSIVERKNKV